MSKVHCHKCGKKFVSNDFLFIHQAKEHPDANDVPPAEGIKRKGWVTQYGFADFTYPVTFEFACQQMKQMAAKMFDGKEAQ